MTAPQMPSEDHEQFDAICSRIGDFEPLPAVMAAPAEPEALLEPEPEDELFEEERAAPLNDLILAGLVAPY